MAKLAEKTNGNGNGKAKVKRVHMQDHRCVHCGRLLFRGYVTPGSLVEMRCPKCSFMHVWPSPMMEALFPPKLTNELTMPTAQDVEALAKMLK